MGVIIAGDSGSFLKDGRDEYLEYNFNWQNK